MRRLSIPYARSTQVLTLLFFLVLMRPTPSAAIQISGGSAVGSIGLTDVDSLIFSATGYNDGFFVFAEGGTSPISPTAAPAYCKNHVHFGTDHRCRPGVQIPLGLSYFAGVPGGIFLSSPHTATLRGTKYVVSDACSPACPPGQGALFGDFITADIIAPPFAVGPIFTLQEPFAFIGTFAHFDQQGGATDREPLLGNGLVTLELTQTTCGLTGGAFGAQTCNNELAWELTRLSYDFAAPTPEPTTLLLWGTSAAGLGLARWLRRRSHKHEHAA